MYSNDESRSWISRFVPSFDVTGARAANRVLGPADL
jgi:hypothetical protein